MSFTRFHDDPVRIKKQLEQSTYAGRYLLDTPGNGINLPFFEDAQIRLQKWGANLRTNKTNLESNLMNMNIPLNRDNQEYNKLRVNSFETNYRVEKPFIEESRATHPAWLYKDLEHPRWETPFINPQQNTELTFDANINSKMEIKDNFVRVNRDF